MAQKARKTALPQEQIDQSRIFKINANNKVELLSNVLIRSDSVPDNFVDEAELNSAIAEEKKQRTAANSLLQANLDAEAIIRAKNDQENLAEAKTYTDQKITDVINFAPTALDTLKELADAIGNDPSFYANIAATFTALNLQIATLQQKLDSLTTSIVSQKETFLVNSSILASNYIDLAQKVAEESLMIFVDRVPMHINEDYSVSTVDDKTRITFINSTDNTFYLENDKIYAQYFSADFDYDIEFIKDKYVITEQDMINGYVDLSDEASDESLTAFLGRIALHQGEDYLLSFVNGVTRFTFINNPDNNFFAVGESLYIQYYSKTE
jgi:hypothetical protein